jgi:hypothetical protein
MDDVLVIDMNDATDRLGDCYACGGPSHPNYGLPIWNGFIVGNEWPYEWGGVPCCEDCYERHQRGELTEVTPDQYPLPDGFDCGGGI